MEWMIRSDYANVEFWERINIFSVKFGIHDLCLWSEAKRASREQLNVIIINIRGQIENRPLQNTRSAGRKRLTAGC